MARQSGGEPPFIPEELRAYLEKMQDTSGQVPVAPLKDASRNQKGGESKANSGKPQSKSQRKAERRRAEVQSRDEEQSDNPEPIGDAANRIRDRVKQRIFESVPQAIRSITELMVLFAFFEAHPEAAKVALTNIDVLVYPFVAGWVAEHVGSFTTWMTALALSSVSPKWQNVAEGVATGWKNRQGVTQEEADRIGESSKSTQEAMLRFSLYYAWKMAVVPAAIYGTEVAVVSTAVTPGALEKILHDLNQNREAFVDFWEFIAGKHIPDWWGAGASVPEMAPQSAPAETAGPVQEAVDEAQNTELWGTVAKWTGGIVGGVVGAVLTGVAAWKGVIDPGARALAASRRAVSEKVNQVALGRVREAAPELIAREVTITRIDVDKRIQSPVLHQRLVRFVGEEEGRVNVENFLVNLLRDAIRNAADSDTRDRLLSDPQAAFDQLSSYVTANDLRDLFDLLQISRVDKRFSAQNFSFQNAFQIVSRE